MSQPVDARPQSLLAVSQSGGAAADEMAFVRTVFHPDGVAGLPLAQWRMASKLFRLYMLRNAIAELRSLQCGADRQINLQVSLAVMPDLRLARHSERVVDLFPFSQPRSIHRVAALHQV